MTGIVIPSDRTTAQQPMGYCLNPACRERSEDSRFEFAVDHDRFCCPKCGSHDAPGVGLLVLTHLLIRDPHGPIKGELGRFKVACDTRRAYLATFTNLEAATADPSIANCPGCLAAAEKSGIRTPQGAALLAKS